MLTGSRIDECDAATLEAQMKPGPNQYKCAACGGVFDKGWTDEEAKEELTTTFPGVGTNDCDVVCDDCFKKMGF